MECEKVPFLRVYCKSEEEKEERGGRIRLSIALSLRQLTIAEVNSIPIRERYCVD